MVDRVGKILVLNLTRLGDILQSRPLLRALKRRYPGAQIHYLAVQGFADVCHLIPEIDHVVPFDFNSAVAVSKDAITNLPRRLTEVEAFVDTLQQEGFDLVINLSHSRIAAVLGHLLAVKRTRGLTLDEEGYRLITHPWAQYFFTANLNRAYNRLNLVDLHLGLVLEETSAPDRDSRLPWKGLLEKDVPLTIPDTARIRAEELLRDWGGNRAELIVGLQPGASLSSKRWPAAAFAELGRALQQKHEALMVVLGNKAEKGLAQQVADGLGDRCLNLAGKTNLPTLAAVLKRLNILITNDTGTQHLAAAVNTPVLSLCFGSAYPHETGPYGVGHLVIEPKLSCFPCSFHVTCKRFRCQEMVDPNEVHAVVESYLAKSDGTETKPAPYPRSKAFHLWRTDLDAEGFWILRPAVPEPLTSTGLIGLLNRELWKTLLLDEVSRPLENRLNAKVSSHLLDYLPPEWETFNKDLDLVRAAFIRIQKLAARGRELSAKLQQIGPTPRPNLDEISGWGLELEKIDQDLTQLGSNLPQVNHLILDFIFGKQNLEGHQLDNLARQTEALYVRLEQSAAIFHEQLSQIDLLFKGLFEEPRAAAVKAGHRRTSDLGKPRYTSANLPADPSNRGVEKQS